MGINLTKRFGYAITDVRATDESRAPIYDDRFNPDSIIFDKNLYDYEEKLNEGFAERLKEIAVECSDEQEATQARILSEDTRKWDILSSVEYIHDMGLEKTFFVVPPVRKVTTPPLINRSLRRFENIMDYYDHNAVSKKQESTVLLSPMGLFPYDKLVDIRTGDFVGTNDDRAGWLSIAAIVLAGEELTTPQQTAADGYAKVLFNCKNAKEAVKVIKPMIPQEIIWLMDYLQVFSEPENIWQLQPCIYTKFA